MDAFEVGILKGEPPNRINLMIGIVYRSSEIEQSDEKKIILRVDGGQLRNLKHHIILIMFIFSKSLLAQSGSITGKVTANDGSGIPGVLLQIDEKNGSVSGTDGFYEIKNLNAGVYTLKASGVGLVTVEKSIEIKPGKEIRINFELSESTINLDEVRVTAKSEATHLREGVNSVSVLEAKGLYAQSNNTSDIIKQISGVNVRQTGGFGSDAEVFINGMSGKQVKFFWDGIPLSYFGSGLGLNVLPVNLMKQIEVYKGVVPVDLGADALGGAINIIPRKDYRDYLDASYSFGSFHTHKINVNGQWVNRQNKFTVGVNSFYNYSDNNYYVDVTVPNEFGNPNPARVRRFHDSYSNYLLNVYAGAINTSFADRLIMSLRYSGLEDEVQHNAVMSQPYGEVAYTESTGGISLEYAKEELIPGTVLKWYGGLNFTRGDFVDTTKNVYTWDGQVFRRRTDGGEISTSGNLLELKANNAVSRLNLGYQPWQNGLFTLNIFTSWFRRTAEDPVATQFYGEDYFSNPTTLVKNATGLAYEHTFSEKLVTYSAVKHFAYQAEGYVIQNLEFIPNEQSISNLGYSQSLRYSFTSKLLAKASYEYATRLPDEFELFGDFILIRPNPFLEPEQSHNTNLGIQFNGKKIAIDVNGFYRLTDNIIWLRTSQFFAQYQNLLKAAVKGIDMEVTYRPVQVLKVKVNATYQDIRNRSPRNVTGSVDNRYYNARLPNIPYFFGNAEIRYQKDGFLGGKNRFSTWWSAGYVHDFFLFWEVDGNKDLKNVIPSQFIQNVGITYALPENRFSITLESTNLFDRKAFDNFNVQRPGRAFYVTLRTYLNQ